MKATFLLCMTTLAVATMTSQELQLLSVSSNPLAKTQPIYSGLRGGKKIYISLVGHSTNPQ